MKGRRAVRVLLAIALGLAIGGVFLSSARHRQFYSRLFLSPEAPRPPEQFQRTRPAPLPASTKVTDRVEVRVIDTPPTRLPSAVIPSGWSLREFTGQARIEMVREELRPALRLVSQGTAFALYRDIVLDLKEFPLLGWWWKVKKLPTGGDVRERARNDQAVQVYLVLPRWPDPRRNSDVLGYVWDSHAPAGTTLTHPHSQNVKLIVLESGSERLGRWVREERNAYQDYVGLFQKEPPRVGLVALMADSDNTRSETEAFVDSLVFARPRPGRRP